MSIVEEEVQATVAKPQATLAKVDDGEFPEVQKLALTGYDFDNVLHLVLRIRSTDKARQWLSDLLRSDLLTFSDRLRGRNHAINIGFTYRGLKRLGLPESYSRELERKAPAFCHGAPSRAAALGDWGESAAERWDSPFRFDHAEVLICIHGADAEVVGMEALKLAESLAAREAFDGWGWIPGEHLTHDPENRKVHFGFRDSVSRPVVECSLLKDGKPRHSAGELLLGYPNDANFNNWAASKVTPEDVAHFFRNGTFGILRKIEQHEDRFNGFLGRKAQELLDWSIEGLPRDKDQLVQYLKAKLCGRWPNGLRMRPGQTIEPDLPEKELKEELKEDREFDFTDDKDAEGCPFGAHIRRGSPRHDKVLPERRRLLFRRGAPYTYRSADGEVEQGLLGLFFCASIEDQFEHLLSEWIEKMPMGPPSRGNAKDPVVGQHDGSKTIFHIPGRDGGFRLDGFDEPFVTTRGTMYAFFPSRRALSEIAAFVESP